MDSWSESDAEGESYADVAGNAASWATSSATSIGESASLGQGAVMTPEGDDLSMTLNEAAGTSTAFVSGMSAGGSSVQSHASGGSRMHASTRGGAHGISRSIGISTSEAESTSEAIGESAGSSVAYQQGTSEVETTGTSTAVTRGSTPSFSEEESWSTSESVVPFMEVEQRLRPSSIEYVSREEQAITHIQEMKFQWTGDCMVSVPMKPDAVFFGFDWIKPLRLSPDVRERSLRLEVHAQPYHSPRALPAPHVGHGSVPPVPIRVAAAASIPPETLMKNVTPQQPHIPEVLQPASSDPDDEFWQ